ncbi:MAG: hypothetical protein AAB971_02890, partial [Patescibacteria group bacterium]
FRQSGMQRVNNLTYAQSLINQIDTTDIPVFEYGEDGLVTISGPSAAQPGYRQMILAWSQ